VHPTHLKWKTLSHIGHFKLSSAAATTEAWYLKGQMLKAKQQIHPISAQGAIESVKLNVSSFVWCLCVALTYQFCSL